MLEIVKMWKNVSQLAQIGLYLPHGILVAFGEQIKLKSVSFWADSGNKVVCRTPVGSVGKYWNLVDFHEE